MTLAESIVRSRAEPFRRDPLPLPPANSFVRLLTANAMASYRHIRPLDVVEQYWPNDKIVERAVSAPAMTGVAGWAAELAQKIIADALEALGAVSAGAQVLKNSLVLSFDGAGSIGVPSFVATAGNAGFVAEGQPIPVRQLAASAVTLLPYKLASLAVLTREMMEGSNAERLIGDALLRSAGLALDLALFGSGAATAAQPAGLRNGIVALTASTSTDLIEAAMDDIAALINAIAVVGGAGRYAVVASPGRAAILYVRFVSEIRNLDIYASSAVGNDILAIAHNGLVAALNPNPEIDAGHAGALHMNDVPTAIVDGGTMAAPTRSLFQTDSVGLKMRWPVTWALRDTRALAWLTPAWK
jgi:hypothetical protein